MKVSKPKNENYAAVVTSIGNIHPIPNLDNLVHSNIFGNYVIVDKETKKGQKGIFFPVECKLSEEFMRNNNLYRHSHKNQNTDKSGFFEDDGRIRALKLRGNISQGFFMPISCLEYISSDVFNLEDNTVFDTLNGHEICRKYVVVHKNKNTSAGKVKTARKPKVSRLVNNQFRFHPDTGQLGRNLHAVDPERPVQITEKIHGTSAISSKILCKKKLNPVLRILKKFGVPVVDKHYDNIYSSRRVLKNDSLNKTHSSFYKEDIWGHANNLLKDQISDGMSIYYEIAGFLPDTGGYIQKPYDYGCDTKSDPFHIYIYRITLTNLSGEVFEFTPDQIKMWAENLKRQNPEYGNRIDSVPELFTGKLEDILDSEGTALKQTYGLSLIKELKERFKLDEDCPLCNNPVPREGIVIRFLDVPYAETYKLKGFRFLEKESRQLDEGREDIEEDQKQQEENNSTGLE